MTRFDPKEARALVERLDGFTPGPWQVSGVRHSGDLHIGKDSRLHMVGPDGDAVTATFYDMKTGRGLKDAHLIAAAPDLHTHLTAALNEIERLREALLDATAHLAGASSAYKTFAARHPKWGTPTPDALFGTRFKDFDAAVERARSALQGAAQ